MSMDVCRYTFTCRFNSEARLPGYLGSTLRGSLGWALRRLSCEQRRTDCARCAIRSGCAYAWLFDTEPYASCDRRTVNARPHPFVLRTGLEAARNARPGERLQFGMTLFGEGNRYLPHIIQAVRLMGDSGIGAGRGRGMGRFLLEDVHAAAHVVYRHGEETLRPPPQMERCGLKGDERRAESVRVRLCTPLRLKKHNRLLTTGFSFQELVRAALRRLIALEQAYGTGEIDIDAAGLIELAGRIRMARCEVRWRELHRWSNRQRRKVSLGGLVGALEAHGELAPFLPLLRYAEAVHLGKQTVFGLGAITVETA